jgi:pimeloyl-ACP methyl ester carboxylesterase
LAVGFREFELELRSEGLRLPATLTLPAGASRGGIVALHGAAYPTRDYFLYRHLAQVAPARGCAVLRYDRRPSAGDVPFDDQATDALAAITLLRSAANLGDAPVGLWGHSQGAWAAAVAAARSDTVAFLALVGCSGVSPGAQMEYATARQVRLGGFGAEALAELSELRRAFEAFQRGQVPRAEAQDVIDRLCERPWFQLAFIPRTLSQPGSWRDMDFDPTTTFEHVRCPVLLVYGEEDDWVPLDESIAIWRRARARSGADDLTVLRVPETNHTPVLEERQDLGAVSATYAEGLVDWLAAAIEWITSRE